MTAQLCPVCDAPDGFHDDAPHLAARADIPRRLILPTARQRKAADTLSATLWPAGCCTSCGGRGAGGPAASTETNGQCADCYGTGHPHEGACPS